MPRSAHQITRADIIDMATYSAERKARRASLVAVKKQRRIEVGPYATFYFESYDTMWQQIHEMLFIERGGDEQIDDELTAYNPLIPQGHELVATLMFEIDDPQRRKAVLARLGGVEETVTLKFGDHTIAAKAEEDVDRTTADGKASSVQFLHFPFTPAQIEAFKTADEVIIGIGHESYRHMSAFSPAMRDQLAKDFD